VISIAEPGFLEVAHVGDVDATVGGHGWNRAEGGQDRAGDLHRSGPGVAAVMAHAGQDGADDEVAPGPEIELGPRDNDVALAPGGQVWLVVADFLVIVRFYALPPGHDRRS